MDARAQHAFATALLDPTHDVPAGLRVAPGVDAGRRFAVHRNNVTVALVDALALAFPVTQALVGEDFFRAMAREFVRLQPPRSPVIVEYGEGFADFIAAFPPARDVVYLADTARLEILRGRAYHAADAAPVELAEYQCLLTTPQRLAATRVTLHPACEWLESGHAVHAIWAAHQHLDELQRADLAHIDVDQPEAVLVARPHHDVQVTPLPEGGAAFLDALRNGLTLGEAIAVAAVSNTASPDTMFQALLALIVQHGLAVALSSPAED